MKQLLTAMTVLFATLTALASPLPSPQSSGQDIDKVVAIVNAQAITESDLNRGYQNARQQMKQQGAKMPSAATIKNEILKQLIDQDLQLQIAKRNNISISTEQLNATIESIAKNNKISVAVLKQKLAAQSIPYQKFKKNLNDQMLIHTVQHQFVTEKTTASPSEVQDWINHYKSQAQYNAQYHLVDIVVPLPSSPTATQIHQAKKQALNLIKSLKGGADLNGIKGAEVKQMGWKTTAELPSLFTKQLANLQDGDFSQPLSAGNGIHIIQRIASKKSAAKLPTPLQAKHFIEQMKFQKAIQKWLEKLRKDSYVKIIDPKYQNV
jgi:peptidyl-prolyl cis-trans isomerase SurA